MKTATILICILVIVIAIVYPAAAGIDEDSILDTPLSVGDFKIYLPIVMNSYQIDGNQIPNIPSLPSPANGGTNQSIDVNLSWTGGDPDGDSVTYDVYFAANNATPDQLLCDDATNITCDPGTLNYSTHYYWQVIARDEHGATSDGPVWDFSTGTTPNNPPNEPSNPSPANRGTNQSIDVNLGWTGGDQDGDSVTYDVYFAANNATPDQLLCDDATILTCDPGTLNYSTHYYWQVIAIDERGTTRAGPVWDFMTGVEPNSPPNVPNGPSPTHNATDQSVELILQWSGDDPDGDVVTYDVFFEANDSSPDILSCNDIGGTVCDPSTLLYNTTYYWQVVARDEHGVSTSGAVWKFETKNRAPSTPSNPSPANGASDQSIDVNLSWTGGDPDSDHVTYDVYFESGDNTPDQLLCNDTSGTNCDPSTLTTDTSYYWQVVAKDEHGAVETGPVWSFSTELGYSCYPDLPPPQLSFTRHETYTVNGVVMIRYRFAVDNYVVFPDDLFQNAPHLPPCGTNNNASRSWVDVFQSDHLRLIGFCGFNSADDLNLIWFAREEGVQPPPAVYITINDRQCNLTYTSNEVNVPAP